MRAEAPLVLGIDWELSRHANGSGRHIKWRDTAFAAASAAWLDRIVSVETGTAIAARQPARKSGYRL
jgi:hypothetical protein